MIDGMAHGPAQDRQVATGRDLTPVRPRVVAGFPVCRHDRANAVRVVNRTGVGLE